MIKLAKARLEGFGYAASDADNALLEICRQRVEDGIRNLCNIPESCDIPKELSSVVTDRTCGEFLWAKRGSGQLKIGELDLSAAVKQIVEGDVSVSFADGSSDNERLGELIDRLIGCGEKELVRFRRIRWFK